MATLELRYINGIPQYFSESLPGSQRFDTPTTLPPGASPVRVNLASRAGRPFRPSPQARSLDFNQFGTGGTEAVYRFSCDCRPSFLSHAQWRQYGINRISKWGSDDGANSFYALPNSQMLYYEAESELCSTGGQSGPLWQGHYYYTASLEQIENVLYRNIPALGPGAFWTANIEESNLWRREYYPGPNYPAWDSVRNQAILCESDGVTRTLEALFADSSRARIEEGVRRANRVSLMLKIAARNGASVAYGASMYQGEPFSNALVTANRFNDEYGADVSHVGGTNGTITLNGRTYMGLTGSFYQWETVHLDYHYYFDCDYTGPNYDAHTSYPDLWPYLDNIHPIAREVGHWLANQKRMRDVHGGQTIPSVRMHELFYEGDRRVPASFGLNGTMDGDTPKPWIPPYLARIHRLTHQFLEGERPGSGYHLFHAAGSPFQGIEVDMLSKPKYNHHLHTLEALFAAGRDMEPYLLFLASSTLTTQLNIKPGGTGAFQSINGVDAYSFRPDGGRGPYLPCFVTRHKAVSGGTVVMVLGGFYQGWDDTRTDHVQIPGVMGDNVISLTYKGKDVQLFEIFIPTGTSGTTFQAQSIVPQWSPKGYGGIITN